MTEPVKPKTAALYLDIVRQTTPPEYSSKVLDPEVPEAAAMFRALARAHAFLARRGYEQAQAQYFRTHSTAGAPPASSWRFATGLVTVRRNADLGAARYIAKGGMVLDGPAGRSYANDEPVTWRANDPEQQKILRFSCTVPGLVGNLDHLGDDAGLITLERHGQPAAIVNDLPDLGVVNHADLSEGRTGNQATIRPPPSYKQTSYLVDSGKPDQFSRTNRNIYVRIDDALNQENVGRMLRVIDVRTPGDENPPGSGLYPHYISVDDYPLLVPVLALQDDGGVFTNYTAEADEDTPDDVVLLPATPAVDDAFYFGQADPFLGVAIAITTPADGIFTLVWEYWDGGAWVPYPGIVDESQAFHLKGEVLVEAPSLPGDWATTAVDGTVAYWIRARVTVATVVGEQPLAAKVRGLKPNRLTPETGTIQWSMLDWKDLRFDLVRIEAFAGGRDDTLGLLGEERGMLQQRGESDDVFRDKIANLADVVTPMAILRAVRRALAPYGFVGLAQDVQNGMTGLFVDGVDAADFYQPGDIHPLDPCKLLYTDALSYGGFEVVVPYLSDGEFGCACDDGPIVYLEGPQVFLGPAADCCFLDGFPVTAKAVYDGLWRTVNEIKLFPVDWILIRSVTMNVPAC